MHSASRCGLRHRSSATSATAALFETVYREMHLELLKGDGVLPFLSTLGVHASVVTRAMVGQVPEDYDVAARFEPHIERAQQEVERLERDRPKGRPSKDYLLEVAAARQQLEQLRQLDQEVSGMLRTDGRVACLLLRVARRMPSPASRSSTQRRPRTRRRSRSRTRWAPSTTACSRRRRSPDDVLLSKRLIVVADELELLLLQSFAARRAEKYELAPRTARCLPVPPGSSPTRKPSGSCRATRPCASTPVPKVKSWWRPFGRR